MSKVISFLLLLSTLTSCSNTISPTPGAQATKVTTSSGPTKLLSTPSSSPHPETSGTPSTQGVATSSPLPHPTTPLSATTPVFSYPIGKPGHPLADGFFIRHGATVENTWYNPGWWHTGEDWYAIEGDTAGASVYAVADGEVVYAGANYPGRVVIVRHAADLYSMYGHLDPALAIKDAQRVRRGDPIGTVLRRSDAVPNHLHFEMRTFLHRREVNGAAPRYNYRCGVRCPPGPGYWPIDADELPDALGWRNPTHVIAARMFTSGTVGEVVVATDPISASLNLWSAPPNSDAQSLGILSLQPGQRFGLLTVWAGPEATHTTSALSYELWYHIQLPDGQHGWVQAAVPSTFETGSDGRPSSIHFNLLPAIHAAP